MPTRPATVSSPGLAEGAPRSALVTGGSGFLGAHVVAALAASGWRVRTMSRQEPYAHEGSEWVCGTVLDLDGFAAAASGCEVIIHLAGRVEHTRRNGYRELRTLHVDGVANAVEAAARVGARLVAASTSGTCAVSRDERIHDDDAPLAFEHIRPWPYYLTKAEAELALFDRSAALNVDAVALRPSLLLGPGDTRGSSTRLVADFLRRGIPIVPRGGLNAVDVRDAAAAFVRAAEGPTPHATYLIGGYNLSFRALFEKLETLSGVRAPRVAPPSALVKAFSRAAGGWVGVDPVEAEMAAATWYFEPTRARAALGLAPRGLDETLRDTIADVWGRDA